MSNKCLYCYGDLEVGLDYHEKCSKSFYGTRLAPKLLYSYDQMSELAKNVIDRSISVPGVQPKLSMSLIDDAIDNNYKRLTVIGALGGNYILKPPSPDYPEMPQNEHLSMRIAEVFGIRVVPSSLIRLQSGELSYITKRVDRTVSGQKIHMLDMFQILEAYDKYKGSHEKIGKAIGEYSSNTMLDKLFFFELTLFSFLFGNNDMHLKNFSMIHGPSGWVLSPAYDLLNVNLVLPEDTEELALTIEGKKKKLGFQHFERLGVKLGLSTKQISGVFNRFHHNKPKAVHWIEQSFLSNEFQVKYLEIVEDRYIRIYG